MNAVGWHWEDLGRTPCFWTLGAVSEARKVVRNGRCLCWGRFLLSRLKREINGHDGLNLGLAFGGMRAAPVASCPCLMFLLPMPSTAWVQEAFGWVVSLMTYIHGTTWQMESIGQLARRDSFGVRARAQEGKVDGILGGMGSPYMRRVVIDVNKKSAPRPRELSLTVFLSQKSRSLCPFGTGHESGHEP